MVINDIHIRFEDTSAGTSPYAVGVMITNISAQSTDENWVKSILLHVHMSSVNQA